jgi:predicted RNase H-like nuclease (RuvC/YqgF family)
MATAKKIVSKKSAPIKVTKPPKAPAQKEQTFAMPMEVKNWIEQAQSTMNHLRGQVERLKTENAELKAYKKWAEHRILRSDYE